MDFSLTDEQKQLQDMARKFANEQMAPKAAEYDESEEFPWPIIEQAYELGILTAGIPQEHGGLGISHVDEVVITEELAWGCAGMGTSIFASQLGLIPITIAGSEEQKKKYLEPLAEKCTLAAFCLTEPGAGSDVAGMSLAVKKKNGGYVLNGTKCFITNGGVAKLYTVFGKSDKEKGARGITAFVLPADTKGVSVGKVEHKLGQRCSNTTEVIFEDAELSEENRLGREGEGFKIAMQTLDASRPMVAAASVGVARRAMEHSIQYAKERKQFGQLIGEFQAVQFMIADMAKGIEAARLLTYQCAWMLDQGMRASRFSSYAKCFAADTAMSVTTDAVQIFGGYGYSREYPVEKLMRDAKLMQIYEGTNQVQRVVIARDLLKD